MNKRKDRIEYGGCDIGQEEVDAIINSIESQGRRRWTLGPESVEFEKELAKVAGVEYAVLVNSGSSALLAGIQALDIPPGSMIAIPSLTFPTAFSSILQAGHFPIVIDCDKQTLNVDYKALKKAVRRYPGLAAVCVINIAGNTVDLVRVREIVGDRKIILDNCDGFGATIEGKFAEQYADVSAISMHAAHIISMGEGGAVFTNSKDVADKARKIREWGRASGSDTLTKHEGFPDDYRERYVFEEVGYNLKPLELQCAMGRVQLRRLNTFKSERMRVHKKLEEIFAPMSEHFELIKQDAPNSENCWFAFAFHIKGMPRSVVMDTFEKFNIETRTVFSGNILRHPAYKESDYIVSGSLDNCDYVMSDTMFIGCPPFYTDEMMEYIGEVAQHIIDEQSKP